ncbi:MAG: DUF1015 domain-containing protein [Candidatus Zixiibacteriota bacterium]|nr:MAG: DUF1015 domain-containing protein [candidate division Zixibacteria bacterium]
MLKIKPFQGLRPHVDYIQEVASPPYDVLNSDEARKLVKDNPHSFLRINKPEVDFSENEQIDNNRIYEKGLENLNRFIADELMILDSKPCYYLYRLTWQEKSQTGLICLTSVEDYNQRKIKKHEHTRPDKVTDRAQHIMTLNAQVGPVFSIFDKNEKLLEVFKKVSDSKPNADFTAEDNVHHSLWVIDNDDDINKITSIFTEIDSIYIADGHHRSESASEVCKLMKEENANHTGEESYNFFLNVIFPADELRILPYNRIVKDLNGLSEDKFIEAIKKNFNITKSETPIEPSQNHEIGMYIKNQWYKLNIKEDSFDKNHPSESIDAAILFDNLIKPVLGIENIRTDKRIDFVGGIRGNKELIKLVDSGDWAVAFSMYPVSVQQLIDVADANLVMPPKSTWFEPKLRSGMVINILDN